MQRDRQIPRRRLKTALLGGAAAMLMAGSAMAQDASIRFDIAAQDAGSALNDFSRQSGVRVLFPYDAVAGKHVPAMHGDMTIQEALNALTKATGLVVAANDGQTVTLTAPQSGSAAGDGADSGTVQALIVTAQKREENIQDVPIAMSAFTQEDLTRSQVTGGRDLITQVPNMTFTKTNFSSYSIQLRGIGTQAISATTDAAVAVAFNNTPFIRNRFFEQEFYDLQRVEVLRGPQGTLYGRNATAGVVNIISQKPKFTYEAKLSADLGNYNSQRFEGMVNMPLVDDKVAMRLAGAWTKRDGYDLNQLTGNRIDGRDLWSTRLSLRATPTDKIDVNLIWEHFQENDDRLRSGKQLCHTHEVTSVGGIPTTHYQLLDSTGQGGWLFNGIQGTFSQGCTAASLYAPESFETPNGISLPYYGPVSSIGLPIPQGATGNSFIDPYVSRTQSHDLRTIESQVDPRYRAKSDVAELQLSYDVADHLTLTSETGYNSDALFSMEDYNRFNTAPGVFSQPSDSRLLGHPGVLREGPNGGIFCDPQLGCSDRLLAVDLSTAKSRQFSQEFRIGSNFEGPFNFSLGANFLRYDTEDKYYVFINTLSLISALSTNNSFLAQVIGPYVPNQTTNMGCLTTGLTPPDILKAYSVGQCNYIDPNPIGSLNDLGHNYFLSRNPYKLISYAVFGEAYYQITDALKLTAGLRWTVDKKRAPRIPSWVLASHTAGYPVVETVEQEWREPTGRLAIDWKPDLSFTDETLIYASYAHGYKAGGANPPSTGTVAYCAQCNGQVSGGVAERSAAHPKTFGPEFVNAFEVGSKNTLQDGRLTLNAAAFYYDYTGYQISQIVDRSAVNLNFDARVWGLELEADWRPLENLRLGFKGGYEKTRVADGMQAIDLMDRTAGHTDWVVVRPFPTYTSNCILPVALFVEPSNPSGLVGLGGESGGGPGGCEIAYVSHHDPVTDLPYVDLRTTPLPTPTGNGIVWSTLYLRPNYIGWDPSTAPNNGEGFYKDLGGKELPNAPHFTGTVTADYTLPLANDWLMTLHGDFYYQSESWARIFNTPGYDRLKAYTNVNLAAIFANEDAGWKVMAYVKNVFDKDSITGSFLNSDDTGLTTNVFLTEPRLYGLRVTKDWTGTAWWTGANSNHTGPYPLTVEVGGQIQFNDADFAPIKPGFEAAFSSNTDTFASAQQRPWDHGDGREVKITYRPGDAVWGISTSFRYGRVNTGMTRLHTEEATQPSCGFVGKYAVLCQPPFIQNFPDLMLSETNWSDAAARSHEDHTLADFMVGREAGLGGLKSTLGAGLRYAQFNSNTELQAYGFPDWSVPAGWFKYGASMQSDQAHLKEHREFKGAGPVVSWDASTHLIGNESAGHVDLDWALAAGVLFGKQKAVESGQQSAVYRHGNIKYGIPNYVTRTVQFPNHEARTASVSAPLVDLSLGLSYEIQRMKVSTGYRWERYFNVLDAGYAEHKSYNRTIDGPYFKIAVGFGG